VPVSADLSLYVMMQRTGLSRDALYRAMLQRG
jgi:hypothetical protein